MTESCETCRYMDIDGEGFLRCHKTAPGPGENTWPLVSHRDWCEQYAPTASSDDKPLQL